MPPKQEQPKAGAGAQQPTTGTGTEQPEKPPVATPGK
jgi:hypothetical protein